MLHSLFMRSVDFCRFRSLLLDSIAGLGVSRTNTIVFQNSSSRCIHCSHQPTDM